MLRGVPLFHGTGITWKISDHRCANSKRVASEIPSCLNYSEKEKMLSCPVLSYSSSNRSAPVSVLLWGWWTEQKGRRGQTLVSQLPPVSQCWLTQNIRFGSPAGLFLATAVDIWGLFLPATYFCETESKDWCHCEEPWLSSTVKEVPAHRAHIIINCTFTDSLSIPPVSLQ